MAYLIVFLLLVGVVLIVTSPWRTRPADGVNAAGESVSHVVSESEGGLSSGERLELEAARDAKYREIRDAELDHQTGKLSDEDFHAIDSTLRAEAIEILRELDALDDSPAAQ